ncbi:MAG: class I SAM-dependent methyltransferase [Pseudobdellovibrionaceae bacterium]
MGSLGCLSFQEESLKEKAESLAEFLKVPVNPPNKQDFSFCLELSLEGLRLLDSQKRILKIDFLKDHLNYQRKGMRGKNELLAKALGYAKGVRKVLDLSAGLGIDAVFMTQLGFQVTSVERSKLLFVLLEDALQKVPELQAKLRFVSGDSYEYLRSPESSREVDAIFFDPMYPHKKKSALPKQEMVVFRELVGNDEDAIKVLEEALLWPVSRVVVKRPLGAEALLPGVRHIYEGKVVRYDVYMRSL